MVAVPVIGDGRFFRELTDPVQHVLAVTKSDATVFAQFTRALYVGGGGDVAIVTPAGDSVVFVGVLAGSILPVRAYQVLSTGTSATSILGLY